MPIVTLLRPLLTYQLGVKTPNGNVQVFKFFCDVPVVCSPEIVEKCRELQRAGKARFKIEDTDPDADVDRALGIQLKFGQ